MADDERRAEIEAVHDELERSHGRPDAIDGVWRHGTWKRRAQNREVIANVLAAVDRVRDARGDDEGAHYSETYVRGLRDQRDDWRRIAQTLGYREAGPEWLEPWCDEHPDGDGRGCVACIGASHDAWMHRAKDAEARLAEVEAARSPQGECTCPPTNSTDYEPHEPGCPKSNRPFPFRSPQDEGHEAAQTYRCGVDAATEVTCDRCPDPDGCIDFAARSPVGEDHEAGIEAAFRAIHFSSEADSRTLAERAIAAYLARVSPSRDGTVAEIERLRDRNAALERALGLAADEDLGLARDGSVAVEDVVARLERIKLELRGTTAQGGDAECLIDSALAEFSPASTGDREENDRDRH